MSRISRLDRSEVTPEMAALYDKAFALRGNVPNMFRVMAHRCLLYTSYIKTAPSDRVSQPPLLVAGQHNKGNALRCDRAKLRN